MLILKRVNQTISFLVISIILFFLSACDQQVTNNNSAINKELNLSEVSTFIGKQHNQILEHLFVDLRNRKKQFADQDEVKNFIARSITNYLQKSPQIEISADHKIDFDSNFSMLDDKWNNPALSFTERLLENSQVKLNSIQKKYLRDVYTHMTGNKTVSHIKSGTNGKNRDIRELKERLASINEKAQKKLPENEAFIILATTKTIKNSSDYWEQNRDKWIQQINRLMPENTGPAITINKKAGKLDPVKPCVFYPGPCFPLANVIDWGEVATEDGGGIIAGAAFIGAEAALTIIGGGNPGGWLAAAGIVAGSSAAFSAYEVYNQILALTE